MDLTEIGWGNYNLIIMAKDKIQWLVLVNTVDVS